MTILLLVVALYTGLTLVYTHTQIYGVPYFEAVNSCYILEEMSLSGADFLHSFGC